MSAMNRIPKRSEIAVEDTWAVEDLFASDELWEQAKRLLRDHHL